MTDDGSGADNVGSGFTFTRNSVSEDVQSSDSSALSEPSLSHDLSDHSGYKHHSSDLLESRYSGTNSDNLSGDTNRSISRGSSQKTGEVSTVST